MPELPDGNSILWNILKTTY